ncbi:hypothetical protein BDZ91DRAFT_796650 [Kalaharituber pfeilii]|nr:hypothetical protein BDZ91DRAFT_796650 [Kalaharituber pfeilii]
MVRVVTRGGISIGLIIATTLGHTGAEKVYIVGKRKLDNAAKANNKHPQYQNLCLLESQKFGRNVLIVGDVTSKTSLQGVVEQSRPIPDISTFLLPIGVSLVPSSRLRPARPPTILILPVFANSYGITMMTIPGIPL